MKQLLKFLILILLLTTTSCHAQKMVQKASEAKKLEIDKQQFIGKPLKVLLAQIKPKIEFVYGNPDNTWGEVTGGTYLKFHFVDRDKYKETLKKNKTPIGIIVNFQLEPKNTRKPLPKDGLKEWTDENMKEYGDMIITKIHVIGEN